jgi:hypothetical protein
MPQAPSSTASSAPEAASLKLWSKPPGPRGVVAEVWYARIEGHRYRIRHYDRTAWADLEPAQRPPHALVGSDGSCLVIEPCPAS